MKTITILLILFLGILFFLLYVWYISKDSIGKPQGKVEQDDEQEVAFIKNKQKLYDSSKNEVQQIEALKPENRGALFERAIARKRNAYLQDDQEYQSRLQEKENDQAPVFKPVQHSLSAFMKKDTEEEIPQKTEQNSKPDPIEERKKEVEKVEKEKTAEIYHLREAILRQAEHIRKRREELLLLSANL